MAASSSIILITINIIAYMEHMSMTYLRLFWLSCIFTLRSISHAYYIFISGEHTRKCDQEPC
jgi:hypothetical protein